jgi:predicted nucleotidyltransferase
MKLESFLAQVKQWAEQQSDIKGVLLVGSYARGAARTDSDVDLIILTASPQHYLDSISFADNFGSVAKWEKEDWGRVTSLRVWYQDGFEVEYGIAWPDWASQPLDAGTLQVVSAGMQIVFDRDGLLNRLSRTTVQNTNPSTF